LTDRGCEFSNPVKLEVSPEGKQRTKLSFVIPCVAGRNHNANEIMSLCAT